MITDDELAAMTLARATATPAGYPFLLCIGELYDEGHCFISVRLLGGDAPGWTIGGRDIPDGLRGLAGCLSALADEMEEAETEDP